VFKQFTWVKALISLRIPKELELEIAKLAEKLGVNKSEVVRQALIFYLYYFNPDTRLKVFKQKPVVKELKTSFEVQLNVPRDVKVKLVPQNNGLYVLCLSLKEHKIFASQLRFPKPVDLTKILVRKKTGKLFLTIKKCPGVKVRVE